MNVAKPPGGFNVELAPAVQRMVEDLLGRHPELERPWRAVIERLRQAAHTMGEPVGGVTTNRAAIVEPAYRGPKIWLAWRVLGDTVTVLNATM